MAVACAFGDRRAPRRFRDERRPQRANEGAAVARRQDRHYVLVRHILARPGTAIRLEVTLQQFERPVPPATHRLVFRDEQRLVGIGADAARFRRAPDPASVHLPHGLFEGVLQFIRQGPAEIVMVAEISIDGVETAWRKDERAGHRLRDAARRLVEPFRQRSMSSATRSPR